MVDPEWTWNADHDIALVHLAQRVPYQPVRIARHTPAPGTPVRIIGWGLTNANGTGTAPVELHQLDTRIDRREQCAGANPAVGGEELCVDNPGGDSGACYGDSGGPVLKRDVFGQWEEAGSTSRGAAGSTECAVKTVYTDVPDHRPFVLRTVFGLPAGADTSRVDSAL